METTTMIVNAVLVALFPIAIFALPAVKAFFAYVPTPALTTADREIAHKAFEASLDAWMEYEASEEAYNARNGEK